MTKIGCKKELGAKPPRIRPKCECGERIGVHPVPWCPVYRPRKSFKKKAKGSSFNGLRKVSKKRADENHVLKLVKRLMSQEYISAGMGGTLQFWGKHDLDHIHGRHKDGFSLRALFDPRNLQLLTRDEHFRKTNGVWGISQRFDFRTKAVQAGLIAVSLRIEKKLGGAWNLTELKKAVESEIYDMGIGDEQE